MEIAVVIAETQTGLFSATLRVKNAGWLHSEITGAIGVKPTDSHLKGEPRLPPIKRMPTWKADLWALDSPLSENADLSEHLKWLWQKLSPHKEFIKSLVAKGIDIDIFCGYSMELRSSVFSIQPEALRLSYDLHIPLEISVILY